ncbi:hypothetical protein BRAS3843_410016 [Bradyrhizobium sp. STM 3843]|nr:hypothetical protein BRAS3843_410016 [Bradyrhizobium sp. STM 3843]
MPVGKIVRLAVRFDDEFRGEANKVRDVVAKRHLAAEACTFDPVRLDVTPQQRLGARHRLTKLLRSTALALADNCVRHAWLPPSLTLPHKGGGNGESIVLETIGRDTPTPALPRKREREPQHPIGEIEAASGHELSPPASVGTSSGLKP